MDRFAQGQTVTLDIFIYQCEGGPLTDPDNPPPTVVVKDSLGVVKEGPCPANKLSDGHWNYSYQLANNALTGNWRYEWTFTVNGVLLPLANRTEEFSVISAATADPNTLELVDLLRIRLKDNHPDHRKRRWTDDELSVFLQNALWDINMSPPGVSYYFLDTYTTDVPDWKALILEGGVIFSLIAQNIFEIGKEFSYSDNGISLTIDRSGKYQSAATALATTYENKKLMVKKQYWMSTLRPQVIVSGELQMKLRTYAPSQYRIR